MSNEEDWDLFAIVRSCKAANNTAQTPQDTTKTSSNSIMSTFSTTCLATTTITAEQNDGPFSSNNFVQPRTNGFQELEQLLNTFNPTITTTTTTTSAHGINSNNPPTFPHFTAPPSTLGASTSGFDDRFHHHQQHQQKQHNLLQVQVPQTSTTTSLTLLPSSESQSQSQTQTPRSRKRKSQQKKMVCHVTADNLSSDLWAWRKYGQKPIKGSPYPRNYYRCSSCKGCVARKQVERSLSDPTMFVVTYTGEHKHAKPAHRNSLAGSTRKPSTPRLAETQENNDTKNPNNNNKNNSPDEKAQNSSTTTKEQNAEPPEIEQEIDDSSCEDSDDDGVLIPNSTAAMSDAVFLGSTSAAETWHCDGGFENRSDPDGPSNRI
ncbi:hypothetical protein HN51_009545 [Arachis hypogaea]|uniref:uncharacterized protein n=1 Tax=Arachis hypogaea TaxID=3818 RepID=UPI000DEC341C|nr:probable WRKY transcription factor 27 [Arachis hypogaea]QHO44065.1 putative WRKY transcription factor [Arachis hypogaea]